GDAAAGRRRRRGPRGRARAERGGGRGRHGPRRHRLLAPGGGGAPGGAPGGTSWWLAETRSFLGARLLVRVGTRTVRALLREVNARLDVDTLTVDAWNDGIDTLHAAEATDTSSDIPPRSPGLNAIGRVKIRLAESVVLDDYATH